MSYFMVYFLAIYSIGFCEGKAGFAAQSLQGAIQVIDPLLEQPHRAVPLIAEHVGDHEMANSILNASTYNIGASASGKSNSVANKPLQVAFQLGTVAVIGYFSPITAFTLLIDGLAQKYDVFDGSPFGRFVTTNNVSMAYDATRLSLDGRRAVATKLLGEMIPMFFRLKDLFDTLGPVLGQEHESRQTFLDHNLPKAEVSFEEKDSQKTGEDLLAETALAAELAKIAYKSFDALDEPEFQEYEDFIDDDLDDQWGIVERREEQHYMQLRAGLKELHEGAVPSKWTSARLTPIKEGDAKSLYPQLEVIYSKERLSLFKSKEQTYYIAFRGTHVVYGMKDALTDADTKATQILFAKHQYHRGFWDQLDLLVKDAQVVRALRDMSDADKIIVTGHSLGAAMGGVFQNEIHRLSMIMSKYDVALPLIQEKVNEGRIDQLPLFVQVILDDSLFPDEDKPVLRMQNRMGRFFWSRRSPPLINGEIFQQRYERYFKHLAAKKSAEQQEQILQSHLFACPPIFSVRKTMAEIHADAADEEYWKGMYAEYKKKQDAIDSLSQVSTRDPESDVETPGTSSMDEEDVVSSPVSAEEVHPLDEEVTDYEDEEAEEEANDDMDKILAAEKMKLMKLHPAVPNRRIYIFGRDVVPRLFELSLSGAQVRLMHPSDALVHWIHDKEGDFETAVILGDKPLASLKSYEFPGKDVQKFLSFFEIFGAQGMFPTAAEMFAAHGMAANYRNYFRLRYMSQMAKLSSPVKAKQTGERTKSSPKNNFNIYRIEGVYQEFDQIMAYTPTQNFFNLMRMFFNSSTHMIGNENMVYKNAYVVLKEARDDADPTLRKSVGKSMMQFASFFLGRGSVNLHHLMVIETVKGEFFRIERFTENVALFQIDAQEWLKMQYYEKSRIVMLKDLDEVSFHGLAGQMAKSPSSAKVTQTPMTAQALSEFTLQEVRKSYDSKNNNCKNFVFHFLNTFGSPELQKTIGRQRFLNRMVVGDEILHYAKMVEKGYFQAKMVHEEEQRLAREEKGQKMWTKVKSFVTANKCRKRSKTGPMEPIHECAEETSMSNNEDVNGFLPNNLAEEDVKKVQFTQEASAGEVIRGVRKFLDMLALA